MAIPSDTYSISTKLAEKFRVKRKTVQRGMTFKPDDFQLPAMCENPLHDYFQIRPNYVDQFDSGSNLYGAHRRPNLLIRSFAG